MISSGTRSVRVDLGDERSYDVVIGADVIAPIAAMKTSAFVVIYDENVTPLGKRAIAELGERVAISRAMVAGEDIKSLAVAGELYDWLAEARIDRDAVIVAIGGGTLTDLCGFVAATFGRGMRWVAIPTTLLAAVDAAVGGKTAVNIPAGKNLVGAIHHPALVAIDPASFATLDPRDLAAGLAETVKTAIIGDAELFELLEREMPRALAADPEILAVAVAHCVETKARIVVGDEHDLKDIRAVLNFGHTIGHALEKTCGYGTLRHGEAIALGMRPVLALSRERGLAPAMADRMDALVRMVPTPPTTIDADAVLRATGSDKKRRAGRVRYILVSDLAATYIIDDASDASLRTALQTIA